MGSTTMHHTQYMSYSSSWGRRCSWGFFFLQKGRSESRLPGKGAGTEYNIDTGYLGQELQKRKDGAQLHSMSAGVAMSTFCWVPVIFQAARRFKWDYSSIRKRLARVGGRLS